ncbi:hypothetical protein BT96DRAFT_960506 [Gymnopus androsaceus JB14]|uniref:DNA breaking-rejoining enzyme n=1 Tax=Gymnopus androsaceus JB14 TaxID=1447944 RepID=A0A6A4GM37_9AGAR|nr:hypothetical protein BT96DRAFT_960506 [Gymnopus androsaceus JB14]
MNIHLAAALSLPQKQACCPAKGNKIAPSKFCPHVPADQRILLWTTPHSLISQTQHDSEISRQLQTLIYKGLLSSTVDDTRQAYGAGLLRFNQFCDAEMIPESLRMPALPTLLGAFVANYIGLGTGKMIWNWLSGLQLWHIYNEANWYVFMHPPRSPITNNHLRALCNALDFSLPRDAAIWAAAGTAFWGSKFTVEHDITCSTRISHSSVNNHWVISIHIPWTKTTGTLETFNDFFNHLPTKLTLLFSYRLDNNTWLPLLKPNFLSFTTLIFKNSGLEYVFGHSYRISGSLKLLLDGVAPEIIMKLGGWSSLCFLIYWWHLEQVLPAAITGHGHLVKRQMT